jgi:sarcosine oxidase subunit gamma
VSAPEPLHPLASVARPGRHGPAGSLTPLHIELPAREIVQVLVRRDRSEDLAAALRRDFALALPGPGRAATGGNGVTAIWIQEGGWYLHASRTGEAALAARVAASCAGLATIDDQSHGRTMLRVSGPRAREILSRGCRLDLHPRAFGPGRATTTMLGHIACLVHQTDETPAYELTVYATLAATFLDWLIETAAEDGVEIG